MPDYADRFSIYPAIFTNGTNRLLIRQINSFNIAPGSNIAQIVPGGLIDPAAALIGTADPQIRFSTRDIHGLIDGIGAAPDGGGTVSITNGYCARVSNGAKFALQQRVLCSTFAASDDAGHIIYTCPYGAFVYINSITAEMDNAEGALVDLTCVPYPRMDAAYFTSPAITVDFAQYLTDWDSGTPPATPIFNSIYYLGRVIHNTTPLEGVTSVRIDPGLTVTGVRSDGSIFPTRYCITQRRPRLSITVLDPSSTGLDLLFGEAVDTTFIIFLYRGLPNSTRYAADQDAHLQVVCNAGMLAYDDLSVSQNDDATLTITLPVVSTLTATIAVAT